MLKPPYKKYETLYLYAFSGTHPDLRTLKDPDFIGCWEEEDLTVLFFHRPKEALCQEIPSRYDLKFELSAAVPFSSWGEGRDLSPFKIGPFWWAPVWEKGPYDLYYDPGVVFGSGKHPTTQMMLEGLWRLWQTRGPLARVLDLGCGSGLLSLLAAKLGVQIKAVDRNPLCVALTRHNLKLNGLEGEVQEKEILEILGEPADLILANLYKGLLLDLLGLPSFQNYPLYLISGFTVTMEEEIQGAVRTAGLRIEERQEKEGWVCLLLKNPKT